MFVFFGVFTGGFGFCLARIFEAGVGGFDVELLKCRWKIKPVFDFKFYVAAKSVHVWDVFVCGGTCAFEIGVDKVIVLFETS